RWHDARRDRHRSEPAAQGTTRDVSSPYKPAIEHLTLRSHMKRAFLVVGMIASVAAPAAAQWRGMPVWNSPKGGTGVSINGDYGRPDSAAGKGNAFGARAALGIGTVTLTAGVASYKPEGSSSQTAAVGGQVDFRVIGGSLLPIAVNAQLGAGTSAKIGTS